MLLNNNSKNLKEVYDQFWADWISLKKEAIATKDFSLYLWYLRQIQEVFSKSYVESEGESCQELIENILKTASCEIKENMIKYNKQKI